MRISDWSSDVCSSDLLTQSDRGTLTLGNVMLLAEGIGGSGGIGGTGPVGDPGGAAFGGTTQAGSFLGDGDGLTLAGSASFGTLRAEARRVGKEGVSSCICRGAPEY